MTHNTSPQVLAFKKLIEDETGPIKGIVVRIYQDSMYIICECGNMDHKQFCTYLRGGSRKPEDTFVMCQTCQGTRLLAEYQEEQVKLHREYREKLKSKK